LEFPNIEKIEENLFNRFQDSLDKYREWEERTQREFVSSFWPNCDNEEDED